MPVPVVIKTTHEQYPELARREIGEVTRASNRAMAETWVDHMLPTHFGPNARFIYNFAPRTKRYLIRKRKLAAQGKVLDGGTTDLVFSGTMRRMLLNIEPLIRAFPTRATVTMFGPSYLQERPRDPRRPNMAREIKQVTPSQERILAGRGDQVFNEKAQAMKAAKTVITKG